MSAETPPSPSWPASVTAAISPGDVDGGRFNIDLALAMLLMNHACSVASDCNPEGDQPPDAKPFPVWVDCSDIFVWGCEHYEALPHDQIRPLYDLWRRDPKWGAAIWCMIARKEMPQEPVEDAIRREGLWDLDALKAQHALRANYSDGWSMVQAQHKYEVYCRWEKENGRKPARFHNNWWAGWERYTEHHPGWETDEWKAIDKALIEQFERENGYPSKS